MICISLVRDQQGLWHIYRDPAINQRRWSKYGPYRAITGHFSTLRAWEAARVEYRYWDDPTVPRIPKMRKLPDEIRDTNYGEYRYSWIKENRWNHTRQAVVETTEKHQTLRRRRQQRQHRAQQRWS